MMIGDLTTIISSAGVVLSIIAFFIARKKDSNDSAIALALIQKSIDNIKADTGEIKEKIDTLEDRIQVEHDMNLKHETEIKALFRHVDNFNKWKGEYKNENK